MTKISAKTWQSAAILLGIVVVLGYMGVLTFSTVGGPARTIETGPICDNGNNQPTVTVHPYFIDLSNNNQKNSTSSSALFYVPGNTNPDTTLAYVTSGTTTAGTLTCGQQYNVVIGDGGNTTYYYTVTSVTPSKTHTTLEEIALTRSGAPTISVSNATTFEAATVDLNNATCAANTWCVPTANLKITAPADGSVFGDKGFAACVRYYQGNLSDISLGGAKGIYGQYAVVASTTKDQTSVKCYQYDSMAPREVKEIPVSFKGGASFGPATSATVDVYLVDITGIPFNGQLVTGSDTGFTTGTNTDVGRSNPHLANAFQFRG